MVRPSASSPITGNGTPTDWYPSTVSAAKSSTWMLMEADGETSFVAPTRDNPESRMRDESSRVIARSEGSDENSSADPPAVGRAIDTLAATDPEVLVNASVLRPYVTAPARLPSGSVIAAVANGRVAWGTRVDAEPAAREKLVIGEEVVEGRPSSKPRSVAPLERPASSVIAVGMLESTDGV